MSPSVRRLSPPVLPWLHAAAVAGVPAVGDRRRCSNGHRCVGSYPSTGGGLPPRAGRGPPHRDDRLGETPASLRVWPLSPPHQRPLPPDLGRQSPPLLARRPFPPPGMRPLARRTWERIAAYFYCLCGPCSCAGTDRCLLHASCVHTLPRTAIHSGKPGDYYYFWGPGQVLNCRTT